MLEPIEPSSGQFINHTEGTFSRCAHCGFPNKHLGPTMCTSTDCTFDTVYKLAWWWLDGPKRVARFTDW